MDWLKLKTDLLLQRLPDDELLAIVKYELLWAVFEERPDDATAKRYMTSTQLRKALAYSQRLTVDMESQLQRLKNKRETDKSLYRKNKDLQADSDVGQNTDRTRSDKIQTRQRRGDREENRIEENKENIKESKNPLEESFEEFWEVYPRQRRGNKQKAFRAYCKAINEKRITVDDLYFAVGRYANSDEVKRGFAKGCEAWLNDDRFNTDYSAVNSNTATTNAYDSTISSAMNFLRGGV